MGPARACPGITARGLAALRDWPKWAEESVSHWGDDARFAVAISTGRTESRNECKQLD
jgi:hypothetical protein